MDNLVVGECKECGRNHCRTCSDLDGCEGFCSLACRYKFEKKAQTPTHRGDKGTQSDQDPATSL